MLSRLVLAAALLLAGGPAAFAAANHDLAKIPGNLVLIIVVVLVLAGVFSRAPALNDAENRPGAAVCSASSSALR